MPALAAIAPSEVRVRAAAYLRISKDEENTRLGVQRQREDLERLGRLLNWEILKVYEDNDITGSGTKHRSGYSQLTEDLREGRIDAVLATEMARYQRGWDEYAAFYSTCIKRRARVAYGTNVADFATGDGLMPMEVYASVAREAIREMSRRTKRKHRQLEQQGMPNGGGRAFGYDVDTSGRKPIYNGALRAPYRHWWSRIRDRKEFDLIVDEPEIIREMARRALEGETLYVLVKDLNERGVPTPQFAQWHRSTLRQILTQARISGRREMFPIGADGRRCSQGVIVNDAVWPAIITPSESDQLRQLIGNPRRRDNKGVSSSRHPLAGLVYCKCSGRMYSRGRDMLVCDHCGNHVRSKRLVEPIHDTIRARVRAGDLEAALHVEQPDSRQLDEEMAALDDQDSELAVRWARKQLSAAAWDAACAEMAAQRADLQRRIERSQRDVGLEGLVGERDWAKLTLAQQHKIVVWFIDMIVIGPAARRGVFDPSRVDVRWKR